MWWRRQGARPISGQGPLSTSPPAAGAGGSYPITFGADNGVGPEVAQEFTLTISGLQITTTTLPPLTLGVHYSVQLTSTGGVAPLTWAKAAATLPKGLTVSKTGVLSGTVLAKKVAPGNYSIPVKVHDNTKRQHQIATKTLTLQIKS